MKDGIRFLLFDNWTFDTFVSLLLEFKIIHIYTEHEARVNPFYKCILDDVELHGSFMSLLTRDEVGCSSEGVEPSVCKRVGGLKQTEKEGMIDYDSEGTDEDDDEVVTVRAILKE